MNEHEPYDSPSRRQFLEAAGFAMSLAAIGGCSRAPVETAHPFVVQPEGRIPGRSQSYAATCGGCPAGCGLLIGVRDGRPLKMEGMPEHPLSAGGLCAIGQALPLGLYDSHRLKQPVAAGKKIDWKALDEQVSGRLSQVASDGAVVFVTSTVTSPTLKATIELFLQSFADGRHVTLDAVSSSAILDAHQRTHGTRVLPRYHFERANVIVSLGADFLGTWISPVEFTAGWRSRRVPADAPPHMSYHVQMEGRVSLSGTNADRRYRVAPDEYGAVLSHLAIDVSERAGLTPPGTRPTECPLAEAELQDLTDRLWNAQGESLVVSDSQDVAVQMTVNYVNHVLGNYGRTVDIERASRQRQGCDSDVVQLLDDLKRGSVSALFVAGTDMTHNLPEREAIVEAIKNVPLVVSFAERIDDFSRLADYVCPDHHALESWMDAQPVEGVYSLAQPAIHPLGNTRSVMESLTQWMGRPQTSYTAIQSHWREAILPRVKTPQPFQSFWDQAVHDGFVTVDEDAAEASAGRFDDFAVSSDTPSPDAIAVTMYSKVGLTDSRHAHNPWLQELPDPVTKVAWDNYACMSPKAAEAAGIVDGDFVRLSGHDGTSIEVPALVQRGQHDRVLSVALAYGVRGTERFSTIGPQWLESWPTVGPGELIGTNASPLLEFRDGCLQFVRRVTMKATGRRHALASTQRYHSLELPRAVAPHGGEVRDAVQETSLTAYLSDPRAGSPQVHHHGDEQLWAEDHPKTGHHWGMVIDQNRCTGCSACLIACQSENNVPVVGKDEVHRQREMHWIRIDRYYAGHDDDLQTAHQPMMCQHCDNAPCETVCPVLATVHGQEGLNEQAYNRCVGTRYCANNCPYKVRRFNWFEYEREDALQNLALNPDVTVRGRGVMEKCSMCVQRIQHGKLEAKRLGKPVEDGSIQTACQQSCPAQAIVFGDMNDTHSRVHAAINDPRQYGVLEEFNFRPSVSYLRVVRNRDGEPIAEEGTEGGHHA